MIEGRGLGERLAERIAGPPPAPPIADPSGWIEDRFGVTLWSKQREVVDAIHDHRATAVRAAHSTGKSKGAGLLAAYWIAAHPVGSAFVFTTAPRNAQIRGILWREISRAHRAGDLPGRISMGQQPEWWIGDELVATGRKPADLVDPEEAATAMQGIHAEHLLCILDEAAGLAPWVWDAVDSLASNAGAKILCLGNPTIRDSTFFEVCQPGSEWHRIKVSAFDSPNLSGEVVPDSVAHNLVSAEWVESRLRKWGASSAMYRSRVLAEFPEADADALIEPAWVEAAQSRELTPTGPATLGCDVARSGSDQSIIAANRGGRIRIVHEAQGADTMVTTGALLRALVEAGDGASASVDVIGLGAGVYDRAHEQGAPVHAFNSSERPRDPKRFRNHRAEEFWRLREALREGSVDLDPADEDLAAQLLTIRWSIDSSGRIVIESKEEMRRRGVSSPDRADAAMMSIARPLTGKVWVSSGAPLAAGRGSVLDELQRAGTGEPLGGERWSGGFLVRSW